MSEVPPYAINTPHPPRSHLPPALAPASYPPHLVSREWRLHHGDIRILLLDKQRQHRTLHVQKDVLPYALC